jgi:8-oxo-dGTP diphosphatase
MEYDHNMELQVGVKAFLENEKGQFLFVRRSPKKYPEVGPTWDIVGGRIEPGTSLLDNLKREIKEEVGLTLEKVPVLVAAQDILRVPGRHVVRLTYRGSISGIPVLDEDHSEHRWFSLKELKLLPKDELDIFFKELLDSGTFS